MSTDVINSSVSKRVYFSCHDVFAKNRICSVPQQICFDDIQIKILKKGTLNNPVRLNVSYIVRSIHKAINKLMKSVEMLIVTHHAKNSIQTLQKSNVYYLQNKISVRSVASVVLKKINNKSCHLNLPICITIRCRKDKCSLPNTNLKIPDQT